MFLKDLQKNNFQSGFTLIEVIVYIGIFTIFIVALTQINFNTLMGLAKQQAMFEVGYSSNQTLNKITRLVANADSIQSPTQGATSSSLSLEIAGQATVVELDGGTVYIDRFGSSRTRLTPEDINVISLSFTNISHADSPGTIRVELKSEYGHSSNIQSYKYKRSFYATENINTTQ